MNSTEIKNIIQQQLPEIIAQDPLIRDFILRTVSNYYAGKQETESKFDHFVALCDRVLAELERDRQEQARKWDENNHRLDNFINEQNQKWETQNQKWETQNQQNKEILAEIKNLRQKGEAQDQKWEEQNQQNKEILTEIKNLHRKYDSAIGALGSRWGLYSEASFRNALKGILEESFGVQVLNINDFDEEGEVFGRPDQVEIDLIIKNGLVIVCEIKSSISKSEIYTFNRKVEFYQKRHQRNVNRKIVISPMVNSMAMPVAENLGIEVYSYAENVTNL